MTFQAERAVSRLRPATGASGSAMNFSLDKYSRRAIRVAGIYGIFGVLWIVFSDRILGALVGDAASLTEVQTVKGIGYIFVTAALVFWLARRVLVDQDHLSQRADVSEKRLEATFAQTAVGIAYCSRSGRWLRVNDKLCALLGYSRDELLALRVQDVTHLDDLAATNAFGQKLRSDQLPSYHLEKRYVRKDGTPVWVLVTVSISHSSTGKQDHFVVVVEDISEKRAADEARRLLEAQLQQSQKMEAVRRLAGGIAHDFNNMLCVILGYAEHTLNQLPDDHPLHPDVEQILQAGQQSAALTRQLLAFARKEIIAPRVVDLNQTLQESRKFLSRLLGEDIDLRLVTNPDLWLVHINPSQLDQVLANLAVNSRDAIAGNGWAEIRCQNQVLDKAAAAALDGIAPGEYVCISVADSGAGMDEATLQRIFEPFFTTKEAGKGTGLGLATVYGILQQNRGAIRATSAPGAGAVFHLYLPRHAGAAEKAAPAQGALIGGRETILVAEDERQILYLCRRALERQGYVVHPFADPEDALAWAKSGEHFDLLLTDVVMPKMDGGELARQVAALRPGARIVFMSGHTANVIAEHGVLPDNTHYVQKPFATGALLDKIRHALDHPAPNPTKSNV